MFYHRQHHFYYLLRLQAIWQYQRNKRGRPKNIYIFNAVSTKRGGGGRGQPPVSLGLNPLSNNQKKFSPKLFHSESQTFVNNKTDNKIERDFFFYFISPPDVCTNINLIETIISGISRFPHFFYIS